MPAVLHPPLGQVVIVAQALLRARCTSAALVLTPLVHDWAAPHNVPTGLLPLSTQTEVPVVQEVIPYLHGLVGWQVWPATQETHIPSRQTWFVPHDRAVGHVGRCRCRPGCRWCRRASRCGKGWSACRRFPALQVTHPPPMQTRLLPHGVPFGRLAFSAQTEPPVEQDVAPILHTLAGWQQRPPCTCCSCRRCRPDRGRKRFR